MRVILYGVLLALITGGFIGTSIARHPFYAFDGYTYGVRAQLDAGIPYARALAHARAVYAPKTPTRRVVSRRWLRSPVPQWWALFRVRVLYPWLASLLWQRFDYGALFIVSAAAYVAAALLTYGFLLRITRPLFAALIALGIAVLPETRLLGRSDLTDMTAYAALVASLWAMAAFARSGRGRDLAIAIACSVALSITRPVPYVLVCAALPLIASATYRRRGLLLAGMGVILCGAIEVTFLFTHADVPFVPNFAHGVLSAGKTVAEWWLVHPSVWIALAAIVLRRREPEALLAIGAWLSILPTVILNPIPGDVARVVTLPSFISLACGLGYLSAILSRVCTATTAARLSERPDRNTPPPDGHPWWQIQTNAS